MKRVALAALLAVCAFAAPVRAQEKAAEKKAAEKPAEVVRTFFDAFCKGDMPTLERLYTPDVKWKDPIFSFDDRAGTMGMWRILLAPSPEKKFTYEIKSVKGDTVVVNWLADYELLGRKIHNDVTATLVVKDGKIVRHEDVYSWDKWARQAFPLGGAVNWWGVKPILIGALNLFLRAQIAMAPKPSPTKGLNGALEQGVKR
jgi:ketosteroid isomerase-like protein